MNTLLQKPKTKKNLDFCKTLPNLLSQCPQKQSKTNQTILPQKTFSKKLQVKHGDSSCQKISLFLVDSVYIRRSFRAPFNRTAPELTRVPRRALFKKKSEGE